MGWLPPGCTDKDIDDAAPQGESSHWYLARDEKGIIIRFKADTEDDAIAICQQEGWLFEGEAEDDND